MTLLNKKLRHLWLEVEVIKHKSSLWFSDTAFAREPTEKTHISYDTDLVFNVEYETQTQIGVSDYTFIVTV